MSKINFAGAFLCAVLVSGCLNSADGNRAMVGAAVGGGAAALTDGNILGGAALGAAAGALCDDVGVCGN